MSFHRNKKQTRKSSWYDWSSFAKSDIHDRYMINVREKFDTLQKTSERHTLTDIILIYKNMKAMVCSPDSDADFDIIAGVLQRNTLALYIFTICLDYVL